MSYGPPPPMTPYGDQDFIKEEFTPSQTQSHFAANNPGGVSYPPTPPQQTSPYNQAMPLRAYGQSATPPTPPAYNQAIPPSGYSGVGMPSPGGPMTPAQDLATKMQTLTPEDRIFLRSWRQDSFYYRVLPLSVIGSGALYYYNNLKGKPHSWTRYLGVSILSYIIGKWSYKTELTRRLETTPSNTPFIQALRQVTGARSPISAMGEFSGDTSQDFDAGGGWNVSQSAPPRTQSPVETGSFNQKSTSAYGQTPQGTYPSSEGDWSSPSSPNGEAPKSYTSYEELRAKNRGLLHK